jgi:hypothetical protein
MKEAAVVYFGVISCYSLAATEEGHEITESKVCFSVKI